jgi:hypothetical protein
MLKSLKPFMRNLPAGFYSVLVFLPPGFGNGLPFNDSVTFHSFEDGLWWAELGDREEL